jgi:hypothetical protein
LVEQFWSPSTWSVFIYTIFYHLHLTSCYHLLLYRSSIWAKLTWTIQNPKWICIFFCVPLRYRGRCFQIPSSKARSNSTWRATWLYAFYIWDAIFIFTI